jgi:hypothetical protein
MTDGPFVVPAARAAFRIGPSVASTGAATRALAAISCAPARQQSHRTVIPGAPFPGDPDRYPTRDEVVAYLERYAESLGAEIRTGAKVAEVDGPGRRFVVHTEAGRG